jgi:hypothetical protein
MGLKSYISRRRFLALAGAAGLGIGLYTWQWEPHWLQIVRRKLPVANLPSGLAGSTVAHLSDLHIGPRVDDDYLLSVFEQVKSHSPEIVVYTGDFANSDADAFSHVRRLFPRLPLGSRGTFGVLGNHDYGPGWGDGEVADTIAALAEKAGVQILRNETGDVDGLQVVGMDELWASRFEPRKALKSLEADAPAIALSHNPDTADRDGWGDYAGWILAGHTHGGQCKPPFLPPPLLPVENRRYSSGMFALSDGRAMYISRGVGYLMQVRFNVRPEVTLFELVES